MYIRWHGQACFTLTTEKGTRVRIDPFDASLGLRLPTTQAEVCVVTHGHADHSAVHAVGGKPKVVQGAGTHRVEGIVIRGIGAYHDRREGKDRGKMTIYVIEADGLRVVHLGDLGHVLEEETIKTIGRVDVLMVPVGGTFTIDAEEATKAAEQLGARIVIPMHYRLVGMSLPIDGVERFLKGKENVVRKGELEVEAGALPAERQIVVLKPQL